MLQKHNSVVNTCRISLTVPPRFTSLCPVKAGVARFRRFRWQLAVQCLLVAGAGLGLGGCAVIDKAVSQEASREVSERARERWDLVLKGQVEKSYEYLSPASRATVPLEVYRKRNTSGRWWRSMTLEKVDCRADACQVTMLLDYDLFDLKGLKRTVEETWIKDGGTWWLVAGR